jgi:hypothetical protein
MGLVKRGSMGVNRLKAKSVGSRLRGNDERATYAPYRSVGASSGTSTMTFFPRVRPRSR